MALFYVCTMDADIIEIDADNESQAMALCESIYDVDAIGIATLAQWEELHNEALKEMQSALLDE